MIHKSSLKIALPKGRMSDESLEYLFQRKITSLSKFPDSRELIFHDPENNIDFLIIRSQDVGTYVETGAADLGFLGYDVLLENSFSVYTAASLPFGECHLSVAHPQNSLEWKNKRKIKVATKYPNLTTRFFYQKGYNIQIIKLYGSIEIAPIMGISDVIVDLVSTGKTLVANGLVEDEKIIESSARLIIHPGSYHRKRKILNHIIREMV